MNVPSGEIYSGPVNVTIAFEEGGALRITLRGEGLPLKDYRYRPRDLVGMAEAPRMVVALGVGFASLVLPGLLQYASRISAEFAATEGH